MIVIKNLVGMRPEVIVFLFLKMSLNCLLRVCVIFVLFAFFSPFSLLLYLRIFIMKSFDNGSGAGNCRCSPNYLFFQALSLLTACFLC